MATLLGESRLGENNFLLGQSGSEWQINNTVIGKTLEEVRTWQSLEVTIRYGESNISDVNSLLSKSSKGNVVPNAAGGFRTIDTGTNNKITFKAPDTRRDLRTVNEWFLDDYSRELVQRDGSVYDIELELIPVRSKEYDNEFGSFVDEPTSPATGLLGENRLGEGQLGEVSALSDSWFFDFEFGDFATNNVSVNAEENPDGTTNTYTITMILTKRQTRIVEENASHLNTVKLREIPDGIDIIDDTSIDSRQTVEISPPGSQTEPLSPSEYVVRAWETTWNGGAFTVEIEVTQK